MGSSSVTKDRLDEAIRALAEAAQRGEFAHNPTDREQESPELTGAVPGIPEPALAGGGGILQLTVTPETLLKMASSGARELVITINER